MYFVVISVICELLSCYLAKKPVETVYHREKDLQQFSRKENRDMMKNTQTLLTRDINIGRAVIVNIVASEDELPQIKEAIAQALHKEKRKGNCKNGYLISTGKR